MLKSSVAKPANKPKHQSDNDRARFELAAIVDSAHAAIISKDLHGNVTSWNRAATEIFGFTRAEMIGQPITRIIPLDLFEDEIAIMERVKAGDKIDNYETVRLRKDQTRVEILLTISPIVNDRGEIIGISKIANAITARKGVEAALRESERQFQTLGDSIPQLIVAVEEITLNGEPHHLGCMVDTTERKRAEFRLDRLNRLHTIATKIGAAIVHIQDRRQLIQSACQIAVDDANLPMVFIAELDHATCLARPVAHAGRTGVYLDNWSIDPREGETSQGTAGTAIREGRYDFCNDIAVDPRFAPWRKEALAHGFRSCASFPIRENGKTIGALVLMAAESGYFQDDELQLMMSVADNLSYGLDALLQQQKKTISDKMQHAVYAISKARDDTDSLPEFYKKVHGIISEVMPARNFYLALKNGAPGRLSYPYFVDEKLPAHPPERIGNGLTAYVLRTGSSLLCTRAMEEELAERGEVVLHAPSAIWLGVPLRAEGTTLGVMAVQDYDNPSSYGTPEREMLEYVSTQVAHAIEKKRIEEERDLHASVMKAASNAIVISDLDGAISWVNPAFSALTGYSLNEAIGKNPRIFKSGKQTPEFYQMMWQTLLRGEVWSGTLMNRKKNGDLYTESATITPVRDKNGKTAHFVAIKSDITEALLLEDQFRKAQRMEAIGRLSAGVAHDFNNHLAVILGFTELLEEQLDGDVRVKEKLGQIHRATNRAAELTKQLLAFSRQQVLQPVMLDLNATVHETEKMLRRLISEDIELVTALQPDLGTIRADRTQIDQVLMNLAINAKDAMPRGGRLTIETANIDLDAPYAELHFPAKAGSYVMLAVSDNGIGMNDEIKGRIFEPFFTTKELGKGTGLGLSTVYGIVKQSDGWIWVYSEPGKGTAFKIYLPRVASKPTLIVPVNKVDSPMGRGETILVVEDTVELLDVLREILETSGYNVITSATPLRALQMLESAPTPPALLVTDVVLPEMSGRDMADRALTLYPSLKVMYMSGYTDDTVLRQNIQNLKGTFLQKPFKRSDVLSKVRDLLDHKYPEGQS